MMDLQSGTKLTTGETLRRAAEQWPDREAIAMDGQRLTWSQFYERSMLMARGLLGMGLQPGCHVGLLGPNSIDYLLLFQAIGLIGGCAVTLNARYRDEDLAYVVQYADLDALFIGGHGLPHTDFRAMLCRVFPEIADWNGRTQLKLAAAPKLKFVVNVADAREEKWPTMLHLEYAAGRLPPHCIIGLAPMIDDESVCLMMFSSGTTANPKACMLSHRSLALTGAALAKRWKLTVEDRMFDPLPFFHMSTMLPLAACRASGCAFISTLHFDAGEALKTYAGERITISYASFPTMMSAIVAHPDFATTDLLRLRLVHCVGPADLLRRYAAALPHVHIINAYGLTEASGVPCYSDPDDPHELSFTTNGVPFEGVEVKIIDAETGEDLPPTGRGEICLRGYVVFKGYYKDPEGTAKVLSADGWLRTGDIGTTDGHGRIIYDGRLKDMVKVGGENVAAVEVEGFLCTHPAVLLAQVIGVPDDHLLEVIAAYVELKPGQSVTPEELIEYCAGRIASYKIPRYIRIVTEWPMSTTKIQKFKLRETFRPEGKIDVRAILKRKTG
jgi:fatty-acyl-CoA synthase